MMEAYGRANVQSCAVLGSIHIRHTVLKFSSN